MKLMKLTLGLVLTTSLASAGDTPFFDFKCTFERAMSVSQFDLHFKNDDSVEIDNWASRSGQTKIHFEKINKHTVNILLATGFPGVSHAIPHEFKFTAPLRNEEFNFAFSGSPLSINADECALRCVR